MPSGQKPKVPTIFARGTRSQMLYFRPRQAKKIVYAPWEQITIYGTCDFRRRKVAIWSSVEEIYFSIDTWSKLPMNFFLTTILFLSTGDMSMWKSNAVSCMRGERPRLSKNS